MDARDRILDTVSELFPSEGVRAVGINRIVEESGVAKMTLYHHFRSKDILVAEWLLRRDGEWMQWLEEEAGRRGGGVAGVFAALDSWFRSPGFRGCAFINTRAELGHESHLAHSVIAAHKQRLRFYLERVAADAGAPDPARSSRELLVLVEGAIVTASIERSPEVAGVAARMAERLLAADQPPDTRRGDP